MEINAIMRSGVHLFIVVGGKTLFPDLARSFVANIHKIERFIETNPTPFIARVYRFPDEYPWYQTIAQLEGWPNDTLVAALNRLLHAPRNQ